MRISEREVQSIGWLVVVAGFFCAVVSAADGNIISTLAAIAAVATAVIIMCEVS